MSRTYSLQLKGRNPNNQELQQRAFAGALTPSVWEYLIVAIAWLIAFIGHGYGEPVVGITNLIVPTLLVVGLGVGCIQMAGRDVNCIWAPLFWNRVVLIAYFGVGSIVTQYVNAETRALIEAFFAFFPTDVGKYNLVNATFVLVFFATSQGIFSVLSTKLGNSNYYFSASNIKLKTIALWLTAIGLSVYFLVIVPFALGFYEGTFPQFLYQLSASALVGLFLLTVHALRTGSRLIYLVHVVLAVQFGAGMILLNKSEAIFPLLMVAVGYVYVRPTLTRMVGAFVIIFTVFMAVTPVVAEARQRVYSHVAENQVASIDARVDALLAFASEERGQAAASPIQVGWARLSYVNAATFAINDYDAGNPGNSLQHALVVWVPRFLYPEKPIITEGGREFNIAATGMETSSASPGLPAEGYWVAGWLGVILFAIVVSLIFTLWSIYTLAVMRSEAWHLFFIVLLGMRAGARLDGMFVSDVMGPIAYAVVGHIALQFLNRLIAKRQHQASVPVFN